MRALCVQRRQNKCPASNTSDKQKNLSADAYIWKMANIDRYNGLGDILVNHEKEPQSGSALWRNP